MRFCGIGTLWARSESSRSKAVIRVFSLSASLELYSSDQRHCKQGSWLTTFREIASHLCSGRKARTGNTSTPSVACGVTLCLFLTGSFLKAASHWTINRMPHDGVWRCARKQNLLLRLVRQEALSPWRVLACFIGTCLDHEVVQKASSAAIASLTCLNAEIRRFIEVKWRLPQVSDCNQCAESSARGIFRVLYRARNIEMSSLDSFGYRGKWPWPDFSKIIWWHQARHSPSRPQQGRARLLQKTRSRPGFLVAHRTLLCASEEFSKAAKLGGNGTSRAVQAVRRSSGMVCTGYLGPDSARSSCLQTVSTCAATMTGYMPRCRNKFVPRYALSSPDMMVPL